MNQDFRDLLAEFNARQVEFLLVGAHALAAHGLIRATQDLDIWVRPTQDNAKRVIEALRAFGAPLHDLTAKDLATPGLISRSGCIDVLTAIDGVQFDEAWAEGKATTHWVENRATEPAVFIGVDIFNAVI